MLQKIQIKILWACENISRSFQTLYLALEKWENYLEKYRKFLKHPISAEFQTPTCRGRWGVGKSGTSESEHRLATLPTLAACKRWVCHSLEGIVGHDH